MRRQPSRLLLAALALLSASPLAAQSLATTGIQGSVRDAAGAPVADAVVTVLPPAGAGSASSTVTSRSGAFVVRLLAPGEYDVRVERVGYRPVLLQGVAARGPGPRSVEVVLRPAAPPVVAVDTVVVPAGAPLVPRLHPFASLDGERLESLPGRRRGLADLARLSGLSDEGMSLEGLPASSGQVALDGVPLPSTGAPSVAWGGELHPTLPMGAWASVQVGTNPLDVEWSGFGGGVWGLQSRPAGTDFSARAFGTWLPPADGGGQGAGGGVSLAGPIVRDTAHFSLTLEGWQSPGVGAAPLGLRAPQAEQIVALARDRLGVDLAAYRDPPAEGTRSLSGFSRVDWRLSPLHLVSTRLLFSAASPASGALGPHVDPGAAPRRAEIHSATTLSSLLGAAWENELRLGVHRSTWDSRLAGAADASVPWPQLRASILDAGASLGADPRLPERVDRVGVELTDVLTLRAGAHQVKFGGSAAWDQADYHARPDILGDARFGSLEGFALGEGTLLRAASPGAGRTLEMPRFSAFVQDSWDAGAGWRLLVGLRSDIEVRRPELLVPNLDWIRLTGRVPDDLPARQVKPSPRAGFSWDIARDGRWVLEGGGGLYHDALPPGLLSEVAGSGTGVRVWQWTGELPLWPALPDTSTADVRGLRLSHAAADLLAPRTRRASLGLTHRGPSGTRLELFGVYRYTDRLARRHDLNLLPEASFVDQHGRPVLGTPLQQASLLRAEPGSNRRFADFDEVSEYRSDGWSEHGGAGVRAEGSWGGFLRLSGSYLFSRTVDNWLLAGGTGSGSLLAPRLETDGKPWERGTSDLDVPHRALLVAELGVPSPRGLSLAAVMRYRSGRPFTPGFPAGVDVDGDGSSGNDPAFLDASVPGFDALAASWECLRGGGFAERNACRTPGWAEVDLRASLLLGTARGRVVEVYAEALNLLEAGGGIPDAALFEVDPAGDLRLDAGVVTIPFRVNPAFGEPLLDTLPRRELRVGFRLRYP